MTERTAIASDRIEVTMSEHVFGTGHISAEAFVQDFPEALRVLAISLNEKSRLLQLAVPAEGELAKQTVYDAYKDDLELLTKRVSEFEQCVKNAVRCSIVARNELANQSDIEIETKRLWADLTAQIPPIGQKPLLLLDYKLAAQDAQCILSTLQERFQQGVTHVLRLFTWWLHLLVECEFVGLVEWTDVDVARYHYFLRQRSASTLKEEQKQKVKVDPSQPAGQRTTYTNTTERTIRRQDFQEHHVHHIVNARVWDLEEYPDPVPYRVVEFLNEVPGWLRPLLQIVSGDITTEEVLRRNTSDRTVVESEITSVYKASPAVTLGDFALMGWSADDLKQGACHYHRQKAKHTHLRKTLYNIAPAAAGIIGGILVVSILGFTLVTGAKMDATKRFDAYVASLDAASPLVTTKAGYPLQLEGQDVPVFFAGFQRVTGSNSIVTLTRAEPASGGTAMNVHKIAIPVSEWGRQYGNINFGPEFGIFAILNIVEATPDHLTYKVTYYGSVQ